MSGPKSTLQKFFNYFFRIQLFNTNRLSAITYSNSQKRHLSGQPSVQSFEISISINYTATRGRDKTIKFAENPYWDTNESSYQVLSKNSHGIDAWYEMG